MSGFDVRKSTEKKIKAGKTTTKYFVCSRAGSSGNGSFESRSSSSSDIQRRRRTVSTKCYCQAELFVGVLDNGGFRVKKFIETHNHPFAGRGICNFYVAAVH